MLYYIILYYIILYYIILYYIILCYIILYYIKLYYIKLYYIILYYIILYYIILYYITLHYIILQYILSLLHIHASHLSPFKQKDTKGVGGCFENPSCKPGPGTSAKRNCTFKRGLTTVLVRTMFAVRPWRVWGNYHMYICIIPRTDIKLPSSNRN